ncbi:CPBP family intramembrane glutamic endopeptidase [Neobacillus piezotolerans]
MNRQRQLIGQLTDRELLFHLYLTQLILLAISGVLGWIFFEKGHIIGLFDWRDAAVWKIGIPAGLAVVILDLFLMKALPSSYFDDGGLNEKIFTNRSFPHIAFIAAVVALSEEILFRGIIQEKTGLVIASIIFAIIHYRYLFNWFLFINIVALSFLIGALYSWTGNLAVTAAMHFTIDFLLGIVLKIRSRQGG